MSEVSLSETMTSLMNSARKHFEVSSKLTIANLINLFNPNENLIKDSANWGDSNFFNINSSRVTLTNDSYKGLRVIHCTQAWNSPQFKFNIKKGKTYTFSTYAKGDQHQSFGIYVIFTGHSQVTNPNYLNGPAYGVTENWQRYSFTFTALEDATINVRFEQATDSNLYLAGYKLEEGSLATPLTELGGVVKTLLSALDRHFNPVIGGVA